MGNKSNLPLLRTETLFTKISAAAQSLNISQNAGLLISVLIFVLLLKSLIDLFFHTDLGLSMGALGSNEQMIVSQGVNPDIIKIIGISLSNGLVGLSGAFACQYLGFSNVDLGQGIVVSGLASVMIGEFLIRSNRISILTLRVILGSIVFKGLMYAARFYGYRIKMTPNDLKLITGLLIIIALIITQVKIPGKKRKAS